MKYLIAATFTLVIATSASAADNANAAGLVSICKKDCPTAKTDEEAHKCAEKLGRLNKSFKKSKCWDENEKYEAAKAASTAE